MSRFLSEDPLGMVDTSNLYAYAANNPVQWVDPTGLRVVNRSKCTIYVKPEYEPTAMAIKPGKD